MKRAIAMLLATTVVAVAVACGSEDDEDQVRSVPENFAAAIVDKDWSEACDQITERAREELEKAGAVFGGEGCAGTLEAVVSQAPRDEVEKQFEDLDIKNVKVDGDEATVTVNGEKTRVVKEGETWLLDFEPGG